MVEEVFKRVVERPVKEIVAGSLELYKSSGKTFHTISHSFLILAMRMSFWLAWKEKGGKVIEMLVGQRVGKGVEE